jgi:hypothetical protein
MGRLRDTNTGTLFELLAETTIGRSGDRSLRLRDAVASSEHAIVRWLSEGFYVRDKGSRNGTWLNSVRLAGSEDRRLMVGDRLRFGSHREQWECVDVAPPAGTTVGVTSLVKWPMSQATLVIVPPSSIALAVGGQEHRVSLSPVEYKIMRALCKERLEHEGWVIRDEFGAEHSNGASNLGTYLQRLAAKLDRLNVLAEPASSIFEKSRGELRLAVSNIRLCSHVAR